MSNTMNSEIFRTLPPTKLFFRCAVPSVITMIFSSLYQMADGVFVGRFIGQDALAAINIIMPIIMMVFAFSNMIATGSSVNISILLGEGKREEASRVFTFSVKIIIFISCVLGVLGLIFAKPFICLIFPGASEMSILYGVEYLRIYALFSPLLLVYFAADNYLRVCGKEKLSMDINVATQMVNVVLDIIFIVFLGQGIWAAAFTSCLAMAIGSVITLLLFRNKRLDIYYTHSKIKTSEFVHILANGSSEFFNNISMFVMSAVLNLFLLKYGGTTAVAAFSVVMYVDSIVGMLNFGMCDALQPAISYCYGAGLLDRVRAILKRVLCSVIITSLFAFMFMLYSGTFAVKLFIKPDDTELLEVSRVAIKLFSFSYLVGWIDMCFSSFFTALDKPVCSFTVAFFGTLIFPILFLFILSSIWDLDGIWLMPAISGMASAILTLILFFNISLKNHKKGSLL
ncbi:MAG: MATE family efflux transporter [Lachnospiraceae bacterium]|nr:MATE family efflux transporter [Lachnospiraceae bacterium]